MTATTAPPTLTLRSLDAGWDYARWEQELPDDGNRYEVIDGVLYVTVLVADLFAGAPDTTV
jgi:hypothetical protein